MTRDHIWTLDNSIEKPSSDPRASFRLDTRPYEVSESPKGYDARFGMFVPLYSITSIVLR